MLAKELQYVYVDTGAMYRAVTLYAMRKVFISAGFFDEEALVRNLFMVNIHFEYNSATGQADVYLNNENVENEIRTLPWCKTSGLTLKDMLKSNHRRRLAVLLWTVVI